MRIGRILVGLLVACFGAALVLGTLAHAPGSLDAALDKAPDILDQAVSKSAWLTAAVVGLSAIPALLMVQYAEQRSIRSWSYYGLVSLVVAFVAYWLVIGFEVAPSRTDGSAYATITFALAGLAYGTLYWLIAGRYAGPDTVTTAGQPADKAKPTTDLRPAAKPLDKPGMVKPDAKKGAQA